MSTFQELLGFDIRRPLYSWVENFWNKERREKYLINPQTPHPLSVDTCVWPSIFLQSDKEAIFPKPVTKISVETKDFRLNNLRLWSDIENMTSFFKKFNDLGLHGKSVGFTVFSDTPFEEDDYFSAVLEPRLKFGDISKSWKLLGYDIADRYFLSGLSNCGFDDAEKKQLSFDWKPKLNEFGLFSDILDASCFKKLTNSRVAEHSPFFIYSLYDIFPND
ncbi:MAG: hypothetical protein HQM08_30835 [Candidatus Riflebacteria bacterium]|nr:hypothetical protein [Candidatus Riflebacteria bacterium]